MIFCTADLLNVLVSCTFDGVEGFIRRFKGLKIVTVEGNGDFFVGIAMN